MTSSEFIIALSKIKGWGFNKVADYVLNHGLILEECLNFLELELGKEGVALFNDEVVKVKEDIEANREKGINLITMFDEGFPKKLYDTKDPVIYLFYKGDISLLNSKCITIIGTRKLDDDFAKKGYKTAFFLANQGYSIVSGLALGSDTVAHRATLDAGGKTIAILPSSLDNIVPGGNKKLAEEIIGGGGLLISEYSVTSTMNKYNFPQRDRIQSLISNTTIIIQSEDDGGSMISASRSLKDGKKVFAIEGNHLSKPVQYFNPESTNDLKLIEEEIK